MENGRTMVVKLMRWISQENWEFRRQIWLSGIRMFEGIIDLDYRDNIQHKSWICIKYSGLENDVNLAIIHWRVVLVVDGMGLTKTNLDHWKIFTLEDRRNRWHAGDSIQSKQEKPTNMITCNNVGYFKKLVIL